MNLLLLRESTSFELLPSSVQALKDPTVLQRSQGQGPEAGCSGSLRPAAAFWMGRLMERHHPRRPLPALEGAVCPCPMTRLASFNDASLLSLPPDGDAPSPPAIGRSGECAVCSC